VHKSRSLEHSYDCAGITLYITSKFALSGFTRGLSRGPGPTGDRQRKPAPAHRHRACTSSGDTRVWRKSRAHKCRTLWKDSRNSRIDRIFCAARKLPSSMVNTSTSTAGGTL